MNEFVKVALTLSLAASDFLYMHWSSTGEDFDKSHHLMEYYYNAANHQVDDFMEIGLELGGTPVNPSVALDVVNNWSPESGSGYLYEDIISCSQTKVYLILESLTKARNTTEDTGIQSRCDEVIDFWTKELAYKLKQRGKSTRFMLNGFINQNSDRSLLDSIRNAQIRNKTNF